MWDKGVRGGFINHKEAKVVVGLIYKEENVRYTISTADTTKPGIPYGYPLLKVHKLSVDQLQQKQIPPSRFVTDLSNGVTARSDTFLIAKWLSPLSKDYCVDLIRDSTQALQILDDVENSGVVETRSEWVSFGVDIVSLYDSLTHDLVLSALDDAITSCRQEWAPFFVRWLKDMVLLGFESAVLNSDNGDWYRLHRGIPTGAVTSVDLANISLFYALKNCAYSERPTFVHTMMRFVDDISGLAKTDVVNMENWIVDVRQKLRSDHSLDITYEVLPIESSCKFLDISFRFVNGILHTDIFRKKTDANRYLYHSSHHPPHVFRAIIVSQTMRYRRIINDDTRLSERLRELRSFFVDSGYPPRLVDTTIEEISRTPRTLAYREREEKGLGTDIPWVITYGPGYDEARKHTLEINKLIKNSDTWSTAPVDQIPRIRVVTRKAATLQSKLFKRRALALGENYGPTVPCKKPGDTRRGAPCKACSMMSGVDRITHNGRTIRTRGGDCKSKNIVYAAQCTLCVTNNTYVGKTVGPLATRISGHRSSFTNIIRSATHLSPDSVDDKNILGAHLVLCHGKRGMTDFNNLYKFFVLSQSDPSTLRRNEEFFIRTLNTISPSGLNQIDSMNI